MYGSHIGTLNVYTRSSTTGPLNKIWTKTGSQGDKWLKATASISVSQNFQVSAADKLIWSLTSDKQVSKQILLPSWELFRIQKT